MKDDTNNGLPVPGTKKSKKEVDHLGEIWNKVSKTDPAFTEKFKKGGFEGTAIAAQSQIREATKMFGPMGKGWGVRDEQFYEFAEFTGQPWLRKLRYAANFWYKTHQASKEYTFPIGSDIELYYVIDNRMYSVSDPVKKVRTDALTKGLSWLGFNADVFLDQFEDNKYVKDENGTLIDVAEVLEKATKLERIPEKHFNAALARINKGEVDLFKTICEMYDVTDVEKSVLFEAAKSAEKRMEEEMANNANEMPVSQ